MTYFPSKGQAVRAIQSQDWYFFLRCRAAIGARDTGGPFGETEDERAERLAPLAVQALRQAGPRVGCIMARMPGELKFHDINGFTYAKRLRRKEAKPARLQPLMPGYFVAAFNTRMPDWEAIGNLAGGFHIYGAVTWTTQAFPEGEPRPFTLAQMRTYAKTMKAGLVEHVARAAPAHHAFQKTGSEYDPGDVVRITTGEFRDFTGPVLYVREDMATVEIQIFGRLTPVEVGQHALALMKKKAA